MSSKPVLTLSPRAWLHWKFLAHAGPTEAGAFGLPAKVGGAPLAVDRLWVPKQECTYAFVSVDEDELSALVEWAFDAGYPPGCDVGNVWFHTHPGASATPSAFDEEEFRTKFGHCQWAVMAILAEGGDVTARYQWQAAGRAYQADIDVRVDWAKLPAQLPELAREMAGWPAEFKAKVRERVWTPPPVPDKPKYSWKDPWPTVPRRDEPTKAGVVFADDYDAPAPAAKGADADDDDDDDVYPFEEWLWDNYQCEPTDLDKAGLKQAWTEYGEYFGYLDTDEEPT